MVEIPPALIVQLQSAQRIVALTGAGVSAESGIPTFRQAQTGLWARYDPAELATQEAFDRNPHLVWSWYGWRRQLVLQAHPNPAHEALVRLERHTPHFTLITQNVDGLHRQAGSQRILELHGNLTRVRCSRCSERFPWPEEGEDGSEPPPCPECGALLRPDVVWFGESLPEGVLTQAWEASARSELMLVVGTSAVVQPAASLPLAALQAGATVVEINPDRTPLTPLASFVLQGPAGETLPPLVAAAIDQKDNSARG